jgi:hypothetical protein
VSAPVSRSEPSPLALLGAELSARVGPLPSDRTHLAHQIGYDPVSVTRVMRGLQRPSAWLLVLLARELRASPEVLARWEALRVAALPEDSARPCRPVAPRAADDACRCGAPRAHGRRMCSACLVAASERRARDTARRAAAGICQRCSSPATTGAFCAHHDAAERARRPPSTGRPPGRPRSPHVDAWAQRVAAGELPRRVAEDAGVHERTVRDAVRRRRAVTTQAHGRAA